MYTGKHPEPSWSVVASVVISVYYINVDVGDQQGCEGEELSLPHTSIVPDLKIHDAREMPPHKCRRVIVGVLLY